MESWEKEGVKYFFFVKRGGYPLKGGGDKRIFKMKGGLDQKEVVRFSRGGCNLQRNYEHARACPKCAEITNFQYLSNDFSYCLDFLKVSKVL